MNVLVLRKRKLTSYTIRREVKRNPLETTAAPGSLEENLQDPERYLDLRDEASSSRAKKLSPVDVYSGVPMTREARQRLKLTADPGIAGVLRNKCSYRSTDSGANKEMVKKKRKRNAVDVKDEEIAEEYRKVLERLKGAKEGLGCTRGVMDFYETRQERFFERYRNTRRQWNRVLNMTCDSVGRKPPDSVVSRAKMYREKVERKNATETAARTSKAYGERSWYLNLRNCNQCRDNRHYILPLGNTVNGLWVRVTENPKRVDTMIRTLRDAEPLRSKQAISAGQTLCELYVISNLKNRLKEGVNME
eukprot:TRINITY_DN4788_c0_g5_i1.p1 TRINITY_DN4788_c0_g5~~TRINITY_DN4788_c0_g5_i1.p1  ORF type:complete len:305 (-),score=57.78 TRINITY_DN4788_c0_g5_i1:214-1128(-)